MIALLEWIDAPAQAWLDIVLIAAGVVAMALLQPPGKADE